MFEAAFDCAEAYDLKDDVARVFDSTVEAGGSFRNWKWPQPRLTGTSMTYVISLTDRPEWVPGTLRSISRLADLSDGWDSYDAEAPNDDAIRTARRVVALLEVKPYSVNASVEGGVCISFAKNTRYGDIECFNSGEILAVTSEEGKKPEVWEVSESDDSLAAAIQRISDFVGV